MYTPYPSTRTLTRLFIIVAVSAIVVCVLDLTDESMGETSSAYNLTAVPIPEGRGLNISWTPNGTEAVLFQVLYIHDTGINVSLTIVRAATPWYLHLGLEPGTSYTYCIVPLDGERNPIDPPSDEVVGWPTAPPSDVSPLDPPCLDELPLVTNSRSVIATGVTLSPGVCIEIERIQPDTWSNVSTLLESSNKTGKFSRVVDLEEGINMIHVRVNDPDYGIGSWTQTVYVLLDLQPPSVVVVGIEGIHERGTPLELSAKDSRDDNGIQSFEWTVHEAIEFTYPGSTLVYVPQQSGVLNMSLIVTDIAGNMVTSDITLEVVDEDIPPRFERTPLRISIVGGEVVSYDVSEWVEDEDNSKHELQFFVSSEDTQLYTIGIAGSKLTLITTEDKTGQDYLFIQVVDPSGKTDETTILIDVEANTSGDGNTRFTIALVCVGLTIALLLIVETARNNKQLEKSQGIENQYFYVKSTYLIHKDGRLIMDKHSVEEGFKDPDMISGMFTAIQDFVRDSFNTNASLENLSFGDDHLTVTWGRNIYLATVSYGQVDMEYLDRASTVLRRLEAELTGVIEDWDGSSSVLESIGMILEPLHRNNHDRTLEELKRECAPIEFCAVPSIEFQHGFVKYIIDLNNHSDEIVIDPYIDIQWDKDVLHLVKNKPENSRTEGRFRLDNIPPGASEVLELYFDPQTCLESYIRGSVTYMDIQGRLHNLPLENILADVNCPIFFTVDNANTAMLNKLMEKDLECVDTKTYRYAIVLDSKDVYKMAFTAASSYNIQFVMDFTDEDPFFAEAWFYGETKIKGCKVLIRITIREETNTVEFLAASSIQMVISGLLAELGRLFVKGMDEKYTHGYNVNRVVKRFYQEDMKDRVLNKKDVIVKELFDNAMRRKAASSD